MGPSWGRLCTIPCAFMAFIICSRSIEVRHKVTSAPVAARHSSLMTAGLGRWSHFLCITCPEVSQIVKDADVLKKGVDVVELRVDLLNDKTTKGVTRQLGLLRAAFRLPVIYTVRTKEQLGAYPDEDIQGIVDLLSVGVDSGVEWLDVEACLPDMLAIKKILGKRSSHTKVIGSYHAPNCAASDEIQLMFDKCKLGGAADVLKVVTGAETDADCELIHEVGRRQDRPYIGLCLGAAGAQARVLNQYFTPVTHELLAPAAPGQLTAAQLVARRLEQGLTVPKQYYLFGTPIAHSMSPAMHNGAFDALLMPHKYALQESSSAEDYRELIRQPTFGGASVTIPHKEAIIPYLDEVRGAAAHIGAVNTIVPEAEGGGDDVRAGKERASRRLVGCNTDWLGMLRPISRLLAARQARTANKGVLPGLGLVIGAGGTARSACYTIKQLGLRLIIANRDIEQARVLAERFGGQAILLGDLAEEVAAADLEVVISTLPAEANFTLPTKLLASRPVVLDVVYKPARTPLLLQAVQAGCPIVHGATMLLEQGIEQFQLWHQRRAPREVMAAAVFRDVEHFDSVERCDTSDRAINNS